MKRWVLGLVVSLLLVPSMSAAQSAAELAQYRALRERYEATRHTMSAAKRAEIERLFQEVRSGWDAPQPVGRLTNNRYLDGATQPLSSKYNPNSPANPYGVYGSKYSPTGARNPYATDGLDVVGSDGEYLGKLNANPYDPNSVANPYGVYGSKYSPTSINNPYSAYGSKYSPLSARNPYASDPPLLYPPRSTTTRKPLYEPPYPRP